MVWDIARLVHRCQGDVVFAREGRGYLVVWIGSGSQRGGNRDDEHETQRMREDRKRVTLPGRISCSLIGLQLSR